MPRNIEPIHTRRAAQLKALAQVRNTLPGADRATVAEFYERGADALNDKELETVSVLATAYLCEVVS